MNCCFTVMYVGAGPNAHVFGKAQPGYPPLVLVSITVNQAKSLCIVAESIMAGMALQRYYSPF